MHTIPQGWRTPFVVLVGGTAILLLSFGLRQNLGLYMAPISTGLGWGREVFAFALALQMLVWGLSTPFMGWLADRYGPGRVVGAGGAVYAGGLWLMAEAAVPLDATIGVGFMIGFGLSMTSFPIVLATVSRVAPPAKRSIYLGIASAGGSSGQLILVPLGQWLLAENGWSVALIVIAGMAALIVPLAAILAGGNRQPADEPSSQRIGAALREAGGHGGYQLLNAGYFVCGFQTMFIGAHLPAYLTDLDQSPWLGATALALIGGFNIVGCIFWAKLGATRSMKYLLATIYGARALVMAVFIMLPISAVSVIVFACLMGLMWLATVPLTTGVVTQIFGTRFIGTLVGITFFSHQIGSFLGIWLGGIVYDAMGNYDLIFWGGVVLGLAAAALHIPIDDRPLRRPAAAGA